MTSTIRRLILGTGVSLAAAGILGAATVSTAAHTDAPHVAVEQPGGVLDGDPAPLDEPEPEPADDPAIKPADTASGHTGAVEHLAGCTTTAAITWPTLARLHQLRARADLPTGRSPHVDPGPA